MIKRNKKSKNQRRKNLKKCKNKYLKNQEEKNLLLIMHFFGNLILAHQINCIMRGRKKERQKWE